MLFEYRTQCRHWGRLLPAFLLIFTLGQGYLRSDAPPGVTPVSEIVVTPSLRIVEGDQPLHWFANYAINAPNDLVDSVAVTLDVEVRAVPDMEHMDETELAAAMEEARGFLSFSTEFPVTFSEPNEKIEFQVFIDIEAGDPSGAYEYVLTAVDDDGDPRWGLGDNTRYESVFINATAFDASVEPPPPPSVSITELDGVNMAEKDAITITVPAGDFPISIPFLFEAASVERAEITGIDLDLNGDIAPLTFEINELPTANVVGSGTVQIASGEHTGPFYLSVRATNDSGPSTATVLFSLDVTGDPPAIEFIEPEPGRVFEIPHGGEDIIPFTVIATSIGVPVADVSVVLNGNPITLGHIDETVDDGTYVTTASGSFVVNAESTNVLDAFTSNVFGENDTSVSFGVLFEDAIPPVAEITNPSHGATFVLGDEGSTEIPFTFTVVSESGDITAVRAEAFLPQNDPVTASTNTEPSLPATNISGSGSFVADQPGTYTLVLEADWSLGESVQTLLQIEVNEPENAPAPDNPSPPEICADVRWLPPISLGKPFRNEALVPIRFWPHCDGAPVEDVGLVVIVYELYPDTTGEPEFFFLGSFFPDNEYRIQGQNHYHLHFRPGMGQRRYAVEVHAFPDGFNADATNGTLIGYREFQTFTQGTPPFFNEPADPATPGNGNGNRNR